MAKDGRRLRVAIHQLLPCFTFFEHLSHRKHGRDDLALMHGIRDGGSGGSKSGYSSISDIPEAL